MRALIFLFCTLVSTQALAQKKSAEAEAKAPATTTDMTAAPEWMKYTMPGDGQKHLEQVVGKWTVNMKMWMDAKAKPESATGTSETVWVLGGRYVQETTKATMMGHPYEGMGYTGYDSFRGVHQYTWMDNMSTAIMYLEGANSPTAKTFKAEGKGPNPMKNIKEQWMRTETKIASKDTHTFTMWTKDSADAKEYKALEIVYKRAK